MPVLRWKWGLNINCANLRGWAVTGQDHLDHATCQHIQFVELAVSWCSVPLGTVLCFYLDEESWIIARFGLQYKKGNEIVNTIHKKEISLLTFIHSLSSKYETVLPGGGRRLYCRETKKLVSLFIRACVRITNITSPSRCINCMNIRTLHLLWLDLLPKYIWSLHLSSVRYHRNQTPRKDCFILKHSRYTRWKREYQHSSCNIIVVALNYSTRPSTAIALTVIC